MSDVTYECPGDISMYIHPRAVLTSGFFEDVFCMDRVCKSGHTDKAIRIGLGDGHGPDESDLVIFGSLLPSQSALRMIVARITPQLPEPRIRKPRPDDPAPRRPPVFDLPRKYSTNKRSRMDQDEPDYRQGKRGKFEAADLGSFVSRESKTKLTNITSNIKGKGKARANGQDPSFKLPGLPSEMHGEEDVFGFPISAVSSKAVEPNDLEFSNKTVVKKAAVKALAARGMPKEHPEFKELFGWVSRGVVFALRRKMKTVKMNREEAERLVDSHVLMYFDGFGGPV
ncbi:hypothetical protein K439DRAFT_1628716 [Ramaria rubella]|nr:hypothetical protein K439DRAFT_1628716 [Ramaria rubella]